MKKTYKIIICITLALFVVVWIYYSLPQKGLGKYVYIDEQEILHASNECKNITKIHGATPVKVYSKNDLTQNIWTKVCPNCVSDKIYEQVMECLQEDASKNRAWLYEKMQENGINTGSFEDFNNSLDNIQEDREWYYRKSKSFGLDVGSYETFNRMLMLK